MQYMQMLDYNVAHLKLTHYYKPIVVKKENTLGNKQISNIEFFFSTKFEKVCTSVNSEISRRQ